MDDLNLFRETTRILLDCKLTPVDFAIHLDSANKLLNVSDFNSLSDFVTASVNRNGLGLTIDEANILLDMNKNRRDLVESLSKKLTVAERAKSVEAVGENGNNQHNRGSDTSKNIRPSCEAGFGTSSTYRIAKLKRDHPEVAQKLEAGEFRNVREAERSAGVQPPKKRLKRFHIDLDDLDQSVIDFAELISCLREV